MLLSSSDFYYIDLICTRKSDDFKTEKYDLPLV